VVIVDNSVVNRFGSAILTNESFILLGSSVFFFIYPKEVVVMKAKQTTEFRDSNDPDGNFQRFGLSTKVLNKKRALKAKRQRKFLETFHLKSRSSNYLGINSNKIGSKPGYPGLNTGYPSKNILKNALPELKSTLIRKLKYLILL